MDKKEIVIIVAIILVLAAVLIVSGVFYFSMVFSNFGLTGHVVQETSFDPTAGEPKQNYENPDH